MGRGLGEHGSQCWQQERSCIHSTRTAHLRNLGKTQQIDVHTYTREDAVDRPHKQEEEKAPPVDEKWQQRKEVVKQLPGCPCRKQPRQDEKWPCEWAYEG